MPQTVFYPTEPSLPLRLAEALFSKFSHDLASPASATQNGLELLNDGESPDMANEAIALIQQSSNAVINRLKYYRICYGNHNAAASLNIEQLKNHIVQFYKNDSHVKFEFKTINESISAEIKKLLLNLVICARDSLSHGGTITITAAPAHLDITAVASNAAKPPKQGCLHILNAESFLPPDLSAHNVQAHYTGFLAAHIGITLREQRPNETTLHFTAEQ